MPQHKPMRHRPDTHFLPSFAKSHGCKPVDECEVGTLRSLGARPSQPKRLLRRSRQGGYASAFAVRSRLWPTKVGGFRPTKRVERCHGRKAVGLHLYPAAAWAVSTCRLILGRRGRDVRRIHRNRISLDGARDNRCYSALLSRGADHLIVSEKPLASFLARLAALFSIKVFIGFFLFCFLLSLPLLMLSTPYDCV